jgi:Na+/phosphate symporter
MDKKKRSINISKSKNVVSDSRIEAGGNIHIGDIINNITEQVSSNPAGSISSDTVNQLRNLIADNRIDPAVDQMLSLAKDADEELYNQVLLQSQRWKKLKRENRMGLLTSSAAGIEQNRIVNGLLEILSELAKRSAG